MSGSVSTKISYIMKDFNNDKIDKNKKNSKNLNSLRARAKDNKPKGRSNVSYTAKLDLIKLAAAETPGEVAAIKFRLQSEINKIRYSGADEAQIKSVIKQIKNVIKKADVKIKKLNQEKQIKEEIRDCETEKETRDLKNELKSKKNKRKMKELNDIINADKEEMIQSAQNSMNTSSPNIEVSSDMTGISDVSAVCDTGSIDVSL